MKALVDAELLKLRSGRLVVGMVVVAAIVVVLATTANVPTVGATDPRVPLDDPMLLARVLGAGVALTEVLMALLGVMVFTQELRYGTAASTFLVEPRRSRVLVAKWLGLIVESVPVAFGALVVVAAVGSVLISSRDGTVTAGVAVGQVVLASFLVLALYGVIGVSVGVLVRSQIPAIVGVLGWMLLVEQLLISSYPAVGRWTPGGASFGLLQLGPLATTDGSLLAPVAGGLVLAAYAAVIGVVALAVNARRDVL